MNEKSHTPIADNRRIAKNTVFLYIRSFLMLLISLYTSRVILNTLGVTDYGIVGAVSGAVGMFSMVTTSFIGAISRFITFELGRGNKEQHFLQFRKRNNPIRHSSSYSRSDYRTMVSPYKNVHSGRQNDCGIVGYVQFFALNGCWYANNPLQCSDSST